jgi:hypothetical protein
MLRVIFKVMRIGQTFARAAQVLKPPISACPVGIVNPARGLEVKNLL